MAEARVPRIPRTCVALQSWHGAIEGNKDIAREAFEETIRYLRVEFQGQADDLAWLETVISVEDVQKTLREAQDKVELEGKSKTRQWLEKLSSVVLYYNGALDMLAQQHPEYLSLVWGTLKFILMGITNHAELVSEFAKAMADIGEILLRVKLDTDLYQTDHIRVAVSALYAHILLFFKQMTGWLKLSRTRKVVSAFLHPFKLELKITVDEVKRCAMVLDAAADSASKAEMRSMHVLMQAFFSELRVIREKMDTFSTTLNGKLEVAALGNPILEEIHLNVLDMKPRIIEIQLNQAMGILKPRTSPYTALRMQQSVVRRSQPWMSGNANTLDLFTRIGDWIFSSESSLLVLQAPVRAEAKAKEIAVELVELLQPTTTRVSWYLSTTNSADHEMSMAEILKSLAQQLICFDPENINRNLNANLTATKLQQAHSEREWADLVYMILQQLSNCFIVIEAEDAYRAMGREPSYSEATLLILHSLVTRASQEGLRIKILFVEYGKSSNNGTTVSTKSQFVNIVPLLPPVPVPASRRRGGTKSAFQSAEWLSLRHKVIRQQ